MAKWRCEICGNEFENFHAQGFDNKIYCPLCYFKKENQELKKKYENAVVDYETTMAEKNELKKQLEEYKDKINWYENFEVNKTIDKLRLKHNVQQKEFIKYLEDYLKLFDYMCIDEQGYYDMLEEILNKYKEKIGENDE